MPKENKKSTSGVCNDSNSFDFHGLSSGFLLNKEIVWGCVFGMIPGIVFVWMSTVYTGQVINIELPLGLVIIGFFLGCGIGIYRKRYMQKQ